MFLFYEKSTGKVVYESAVFDPGPPESGRPDNEWQEWYFNVLPLGHTPDTVECRWLDERVPEQRELARRALKEKVQFDVDPGTAAWDRGKDVPRFVGPRVETPMPEALRRRNDAPNRMTSLRKKGAAALTPAERNEVLDLMMLERTPPHELLEG